MADKAEIKKAILGVAGNPSVGVIAELVDAMAEAVADLDKPASPVRYQEQMISAKETRVIDSRETR